MMAIHCSIKLEDNQCKQVSDDFLVILLRPTMPSTTSLCSSHPSIINRSVHICTLISTIHLISHLLIISLLRKHSRSHGWHKHHPRHRRTKSHCSHHKRIRWEWRKWHPRHWHSWHERRHTIELIKLLLLLLLVLVLLLLLLLKLIARSGWDGGCRRW